MYSVGMSIEDIQKAMQEKLSYAPEIGAKIKFNLGDDGIIFIDGTQNPPVLNNEDNPADTTFSCPIDVMKNIMAGTQDPTMAFMTGKLKVEGSMGYAMKIASMLED